MFNTLPDKVIIEMEEELNKFRAVIEDYSLPTPDIESALSQIFEAMESPDYTKQCLMIDSCATDMASGEGLYENTRLSTNEVEKVRDAVLEISLGIRDKLREINGTFDQYVYYCFDRMLDKNTLVLKPMINAEELF